MKAAHEAMHRSRAEEVAQADPNSSKTANLTFLYQNNYVGDVSINGEKVKLVIDTLTSDTWIVKNGFTCVDATDQIIDVRHTQGSGRQEQEAFRALEHTADKFTKTGGRVRLWPRSQRGLQQQRIGGGKVRLDVSG